MKHILITTIAAVVLVGCGESQPPEPPTAKAPDISIHDAAVEAGDPLVFHVTDRLQIPADDGQKSVTTDGKFFYVQNTQPLFKYDLNGKLVRQSLN